MISESNSSSKSNQYLLLFFAIVFFYLYFQNNITGVLHNFHGNDFAHNYVAGNLLLDGGNPYDRNQLIQTAFQLGIERINPYVYPLFVSELFIPLTYFSYPSAQMIWFILNQFFLFISIGLFISILPGEYRIPMGLLSLGLVIFFIPLIRTFTAGQLNLLILFLIMLLLKLSLERKLYPAGIVLGLATLIKIYPGFFIFHYLVKKEYKIVLSAILTMISISIFTILLFGWSLFTDYFKILKSMSYGQSVWSDILEPFHVAPANQSIHALIAHIFTENPVTQYWINNPQLAKVLSILFSVIFFVVSLWTAQRNKIDSDPLSKSISFYFSLLSYLLILSLLWDHYLVFIPIIITTVLAYLIKYKKITLSQVLLLSIIYIWIAMPFVFFDDYLKSGIQILWMSFKLYPILILWIYLLYIIWNHNISNQPITSSTGNI